MTDRDPLPSLEQLDEKLKQVEKDKEAADRGRTTGMALRLGAEFASGAIVGAVIGMMLDRWLDTKPWLLIVCLIFGTVAGVRTMLQTIERYSKSLEEEQDNS